jgi:cyclopropane-fatty-acyl-phospholipid synthase
LLAHARDVLALELGFLLWDGSTVPTPLAPSTLTIALADEGVVAALLRRPRLATLLNLWVTARIDILNGTIFDLVARRPKVRTRDIRGKLDKGLLLKGLAPFLPVSSGGPWPLDAIGKKGPVDGSAAENKANISYHYDVSNKFYELILDERMVYSCGYFKNPNDDISTAQHNKLEMICRKLRFKAGETFLDVGCGWGALVCHAARYHGVRAHGVTLSEEQFALAKTRVAEYGLQGRVTIELKDYHALEGGFDKIASIGMFEHVGIDNHATYFAKMHQLLNQGGLYLHHAITRPAKRDDKVFRRKRPEYAAIIRYIFPGAELDHIGMAVANLERSGFEVHDVEGWREHYARTCRLWHDNLLAHKDEAEREVGSVKTRLWIAYLAGCSIAFERSTLCIFQTLVSKRTRGPSGVPLTRADLYEA